MITFGPSDADLRVISYGGGVQSTAMTLMALRGEWGDPPDLVVFSDTQFEPASVYRTVDAVEAVELAGEPKRSKSTFVGGLKTLPLRITPAPTAP